MEFNDEIVFASSASNVSRIINQAEKEGKLRKIAPRIYTANLWDSVEYIIKRHFFDILKWRFPNAVISHRSAFGITPDRNR